MAIDGFGAIGIFTAVLEIRLNLMRHLDYHNEMFEEALQLLTEAEHDDLAPYLNQFDLVWYAGEQSWGIAPRVEPLGFSTRASQALGKMLWLLKGRAPSTLA